MSIEIIIQILTNLGVLLGMLVGGMTFLIALKAQVQSFATEMRALKLDFSSMQEELRAMSKNLIEIARQDERINALERDLHSRFERVWARTEEIKAGKAQAPRGKR